jgi:hypothetical protein
MEPTDYEERQESSPIKHVVSAICGTVVIALLTFFLCGGPEAWSRHEKTRACERAMPEQIKECIDSIP